MPNSTTKVADRRCPSRRDGGDPPIFDGEEAPPTIVPGKSSTGRVSPVDDWFHALNVQGLVTHVGIKIMQVHGREVAALVGRWDGRSDRRRLRRAGWPELWVNEAHGAEEPSLDFLADIPEVTAVSLLDRDLTDLSGLQQLDRLEVLLVNQHGAPPLSLEPFKALRRLYAEQRLIDESVFECEGLRELYLYGYQGTDVRPLSSLEELVRLELGPARSLSSLHGVDALAHLQWLGIYHAPRLQDLTALTRTIETLEHLHLEACKAVADVEIIQQVREVAEVVIEDCPSLSSLGERS